MGSASVVARTLAAFTVFAVSCTGAIAQELLFEVHGSEARERYGAQLAWLDDLDGDGVDDLAASGPGDGIEVLRILSGRDLAELHEIERHADDGFGSALAVVDDLDGDGLRDLAIGAPDAEGGAGRIEMRSPVDGRLLRELRAPEPGALLGVQMAVVDDVDGDGLRDLAALRAQPLEATHGRREAAEIVLLSTRGGVLAVAGGPIVPQVALEPLIAIADVDCDGARDLATSLPFGDPTQRRYDSLPSLTFLSGRTLARVGSIDLPDDRGDPHRIEKLAEIGDADGDGVADFAAARGEKQGPHDWPFFDSDVWVISGRDRTVLRHWHGGWEYLGTTLAAAGDVDRDGFDDLVTSRHLDGGSASVLTRIAVLSVRTGAVLREVAGPFDPFTDAPKFGQALAGGRDLDGDGRIDLVLGDPDAGWRLHDGRVFSVSLLNGGVLAEREGEDRQHGYAGAVAFFGDRDGDGRIDLAVGEVSRQSPGAVALLSGADGSLLARIEPAAPDTEFGKVIAATPDLDGDGCGDLAIGAGRRVELRSSASGGLLRTLALGGTSAWVATIAVGMHADGSVDVAVGAQTSPFPRGRFVLFDAATGALELQATGSSGEQLGAAIAFTGDTNGDGFGEWAVGAPGSDRGGVAAGRVILVDGRTRTMLGEVLGTQSGALLGDGLAAAGDVDGDGAGDFLAGAPASGGQLQGAVVLVSGADLTTHARWDGAPWTQLGRSLTDLGDCNGDGFREFFAPTLTERRHGFVAIRSVATGLEQARLGVTLAYDALPLASLPAWLHGQGASPLAAVLDARLVQGESGGALRCYSLPELFFDVTPARAASGERVRGDVRGAPPGALCGIYLVTIDGEPFEEFLDFGPADSLGTYVDWDVVPPGMSGLRWILRAYSTGFDGRLATSSDVVLEFE